MKKLTTLVLTLALSLFVASTSSFAKGKPVTGTWSGTLIDKHCGAKMAANPAGHEKACVMKCAANGKGLGVAIDGKWYSFDRKGERLAWAILNQSTATADVQVTVDGKLSGNKITVTKITPKT